MNVLSQLSGLIIIGILHIVSTGGIAGAEVPSLEKSPALIRAVMIELRTLNTSYDTISCFMDAEAMFDAL